MGPDSMFDQLSYQVCRQSVSVYTCQLGVPALVVVCSLSISAAAPKWVVIVVFASGMSDPEDSFRYRGYSSS